MPENAEDIRAAVEQRFAQVASSPGQEKKFPVGPASAKKLGYDPQEIDALPGAVSDILALNLAQSLGGLPVTPS